MNQSIKFTYLAIFNTIFIAKLMQSYSIDISQAIEQNLSSLLLNSAYYNKYVRPLKKVTIDLSIQLNQIVSIDEKSQIATLSLSFNQLWVDSRLSWNTSEFGKMEEITLIAKNIWIPDTTILNSADYDGAIKPNENTYAYVVSDGSVYLTTSSAVTRVRCRLSMKYFPFDKQTCFIKLQSWSFTNDMFDMTFNSSGILLEGYTKNEIWDLISLTARRYTETVEGYNYTAAELEIKIARKPLFYIINILLPCFALNILSLIAFFFPYVQQISLSKYNFFKISNDETFHLL